MDEVDGKSSATMPRQLGRVMLITHIVVSVGWLGAVAGFLVLSIAGLTSCDVSTVRGVYLSMNLIGLLFARSAQLRCAADWACPIAWNLMGFVSAILDDSEACSNDRLCRTSFIASVHGSGACCTAGNGFAVGNNAPRKSDRGGTRYEGSARNPSAADSHHALGIQAMGAHALWTSIATEASNDAGQHRGRNPSCACRCNSYTNQQSEEAAGSIPRAFQCIDHHACLMHHLLGHGFRGHGF